MITDILFDELLILISNNGLIKGSKYRITDFQTTHYYTDIVSDYTVKIDEINYGDIEPLIITALSQNTIDKNAFSAAFPDDIILYDYDITHYNGNGDPEDPNIDICFNIPSGIFKGVITYRKDMKKNISAYYDWRNVKYRRWRVEPNSGDFNISTTYNKNQTVGNVVDGKYGIYRSLINNNIGNSQMGYDYGYWELLCEMPEGSGDYDITQLNISYDSIGDRFLSYMLTDLFVVNSDKYCNIKTFNDLENTYNVSIPYYNKLNDDSYSAYMNTRLPAIVFYDHVRDTILTSNSRLLYFAGICENSFINKPVENIFLSSILNCNIPASIWFNIFIKIGNGVILGENSDILYSVTAIRNSKPALRAFEFDGIGDYTISQPIVGYGNNMIGMDFTVDGYTMSPITSSYS